MPRTTTLVMVADEHMRALSGGRMCRSGDRSSHERTGGCAAASEAGGDRGEAENPAPTLAS